MCLRIRKSSLRATRFLGDDRRRKDVSTPNGVSKQGVRKLFSETSGRTGAARSSTGSSSTSDFFCSQSSPSLPPSLLRSHSSLRVHSGNEARGSHPWVAAVSSRAVRRVLLRSPSLLVLAPDGSGGRADGQASPASQRAVSISLLFRCAITQSRHSLISCFGPLPFRVSDFGFPSTSSSPSSRVSSFRGYFLVCFSAFTENRVYCAGARSFVFAAVSSRPVCVLVCACG